MPWLGAKDARRIPEVFDWDSNSQTVLDECGYLKTHGLLKRRDCPLTTACVILITITSIYSAFHFISTEPNPNRNMVYLKRLLALSSLLSLGQAQWSRNVPLETRTLDEIYEAAKKESGPLIVSSGGDGKYPCRSRPYLLLTACLAGNQNDFIIDAFQKRFPDIQVNWTVDLSKYHASRIDRGFYGKGETTDVVILQTLQDFPRWKSQNRLMYYKPAVWNDIYASERDPHGAYLPIAECKLPFLHELK